MLSMMPSTALLRGSIPVGSVSFRLVLFEHFLSSSRIVRSASEYIISVFSQSGMEPSICRYESKDRE